MDEYKRACDVQLSEITDVGKVLAGVQVPREDDEAFGQFLSNLGFQYIEETENKVYRQYLRAGGGAGAP